MARTAGRAKKPAKSKAEAELDKLLEEARAAEAEAAVKEANAPAEAKPKTSEQPPKPPEPKSDLLKWFFIGLIIVSVIGGYFLYSYTHSNNQPPIIPVTGLGVYNPEDWLEEMLREKIPEDPPNAELCSALFF